MSQETLWYEVERIKGWIRRRRLLSIIKYTIYVLLIVGVILHLYYVYEASQSLQVTMYRAPTFERAGFMTYRITVYPNILNPSDVTFEAKNLYVKVFVNGYYVGEIFKPYLEIKPGDNQETFTFQLDLRDLPQIVKETLAADGTLTISFSGLVTIPLKAFGIIPWQEITIPLDILPEQEFQISEEDSSLLSKLDLVKYLEEVNALKDDIKSLKKRIDALKIEELTSEINSLKSKINDILTALDQVKGRISILEQREESIDVTFSVSDLLDTPLSVSLDDIRISPEDYESITIKGSLIMVKGMKRNTLYTISIEWASYLYGGVVTGTELIAYPKELEGAVIYLPIADLEIEVVDKFYNPLSGAIVRIGSAEEVTGYDGKVRFYLIPVEDKNGLPLTYYVEIEYAGYIFETNITVSKDSNTWSWTLRLDYP